MAIKPFMTTALRRIFPCPRYGTVGTFAMSKLLHDAAIITARTVRARAAQRLEFGIMSDQRSAT